MKTINDYAELVKEQHALNKIIAPVETDASDASQNYAVGDHLIIDGILYDVTSPISEHDAITAEGNTPNISAASDIESQITAKQNALTFDNVPTQNSANPVKSGGVYSAIKAVDDKADKLAAEIDLLAKGTVFGMFINGHESDPSDAVVYLKDAAGMTPAKMDYSGDKFDYGSWENAFFMPRPCMLKADGTVDYYLDPDNFAKKEDGTTDSDIANTAYNGNAMMEWGQNGKKIWMRIIPSADGESGYVYIADHQVTEDFHDWPFHNCDGVSADHFYTPIYNGSVISNKMRSLSGQQVSKTLTGTAEITAAKANNTTAKELWNIECVADRILISFLLILMGKSLDTQTVFGQGLNASGSEAINDAFRTGVHNAKGLFYGTNSGAAATYTNAVKVFGMENFYGFQWRRHNGLILSNGKTKVKLTFGTEDGSSVTGYNTDGTDYIVENNTALSGTSGNYISEVKFTEDGMFPQVMSGSSTTFLCDACWFNNGIDAFALFGGASVYGAAVGAFCATLGSAVSVANGIAGAAPSCKPLA